LENHTKVCLPTDAKSSVSNFYLEEPEENILYFIEKNAPTLPEWKREIYGLSGK
jgi:spore cortex formation protein SpoVR/YcgB (stage V sporulation)